MALYLVTRPQKAEHLRNPSGIHAALVDAASGPAAITAANALAPHLNAPFAGYDTTQVAATAAGGFVPAIVQGEVLGSAYTGPGRGA
ncbi:hypothetical protein [uncultured Roseobacter sp.]|uniref:hypothetical protein n=1 Tax=uncultured Roseobacter sp. TaxID=114847 RepID=UPI002602F79D|nr:hypothetical protein [uncultured Roseobacter sp.]